MCYNVVIMCLPLFSISLQPFPVLENKTGPITIDYLTKRLLALGAVQTGGAGGFLVDCETFHSMPPLGKSFDLHF